jgi:hypothetical protein
LPDSHNLSIRTLFRRFTRLDLGRVAWTGEATGSEAIPHPNPPRMASGTQQGLPIAPALATLKACAY